MSDPLINDRYSMSMYNKYFTITLQELYQACKINLLFPILIEKKTTGNIIKT